MFWNNGIFLIQNYMTAIFSSAIWLKQNMKSHGQESLWKSQPPSLCPPGVQTIGWKEPWLLAAPEGFSSLASLHLRTRLNFEVWSVTKEMEIWIRARSMLSLTHMFQLCGLELYGILYSNGCAQRRLCIYIHGQDLSRWRKKKWWRSRDSFFGVSESRHLDVHCSTD